MAGSKWAAVLGAKHCAALRHLQGMCSEGFHWLCSPPRQAGLAFGPPALAVMSPRLWGVEQRSPQWQNAVDFPRPGASLHWEHKRFYLGILREPRVPQFLCSQPLTGPGHGHRATLTACLQSRKERGKMTKGIHLRKKRRERKRKGSCKFLALPTQPALT